jgi:hypothetical protein
MSTLWREWCIFYCEWALGHLPASHPDVPDLVLRRRALMDQRPAYFSVQ